MFAPLPHRPGGQRVAGSHAVHSSPLPARYDEDEAEGDKAFSINSLARSDRANCKASS